jgi:hypothetical protein
MLAIVHHLARAGMLIGRCTATEKRLSLKEGDLVTGVGQGTRGGESSKSAADNAYTAMLCI